MYDERDYDGMTSEGEERERRELAFQEREEREALELAEYEAECAAGGNEPPAIADPVHAALSGWLASQRFAQRRAA